MNKEEKVLGPFRKKKQMSKRKLTTITDINQINTKIELGKLLLAAIAKITTESQTDKTPDEVLSQLNELKDKMMFSIRTP